MHSPKLFIAVLLATVLAACSKAKPQPDAALARDLDLALSTGSRGVVSQAELGIKPEAKAHAPAAEKRARSVEPVARPRPSVKETAPVPEPARVKSEPTEEEAVAMASAPEPITVTQQAPAPEPEPSAEPQPSHTGHGGGTFPAGGGGTFRIPGFGGMVIIRGGGSGSDPCDEHDRRRGRGGMAGGILMNPRAPMPAGIGGAWGGGGGGRFGGR